MNEKRWAVGAATAVGVQVGAAIVATRWVIDELGPASLACLRYLLALVCLLPFAWAQRGGPRIAARDVPAIMLLGIGQFGVLIALLNIGLRSVSAAKAALLFATFPLLALLVAALLGHERLTARKLLGVLFTIAGVAVALGRDAFGAPSQWLGEAAVLASALCGAACSVLYRPYLRRYPALPVGVYAMAAAVVFLAVWAGFEGIGTRLGQLSNNAWAAVVFIGVTSGGGYFLWLWALRHAPASRVALFLALSPLTAIVLGALWLDEAATPQLWFAFALVFAGLAVARDEGR